MDGVRVCTIGSMQPISRRPEGVEVGTNPTKHITCMLQQAHECICLLPYSGRHLCSDTTQTPHPRISLYTAEDHFPCALCWPCFIVASYNPH